MSNEKIEIINGLNSKYEILMEQLKVIEQQVAELTLFDEELKIIQENENESMLAQIGKSVFASVKIGKEGKLLVDVGAGYFVRKSMNEVKAVALEQKQKLESFKLQISSELDNVTEKLQEII